MLGVNALYVAAEFAAVSIRHSRIRNLAEEGSTIARRLLPWVEDGSKLDRYVACCQVGITFSSLILGAVGQAWLTLQIAPLLQAAFSLEVRASVSITAVGVLIGLTTVQMVLGELVPKSLALQFSTKVALGTYYPMALSLRLFSWFITVLNGSGALLLRAMGVSEAGHRHIHSPEEIELLIAESRDGGLLEPEEQNRLRKALRLSNRPASQLMVSRLHMVTIDINAPSETVLERVVESPYSRFPVVRGSKDNVVGVLHSRDAVLHYAQHKSLPPVSELMRTPLVVPKTVTADRLLAIFREHRCPQAILVNEYGAVEGLVTLEDLLAEVFGNVADELKNAGRAPEQLPDGRVRLPGALKLEEVERWLGVPIAGEASTIGGQVFHVLGHLPNDGDRVTFAGLEFEVESVVNRTVASVLARPHVPPPRLAEPERP